MKERCRPSCKPYLPEAKKKVFGFVAACWHCKSLYVCGSKAYGRHQWFEWVPLDGEQS